MSELVLKLSNVSKTYPGVRALDQVNFECRAGEVHAILGENGSGKSTLMKIASGVVNSDTGSIEICGHPLVQANARLAGELGLATVYQDDSLVLELTVAQNIYLASSRGSVPYGQMRTSAARQLAAFDLDISPDALVSDLAPGQRQFIEIIKALQLKPKVLLLDEPTATLDSEGVSKLAGIIREMTSQGTGVIYVSHRLPEVLDLADRISILRDGEYCGTYDVTAELSEYDLISLMVGRDINSEYGEKPSGGFDRPFLSVLGLTGATFEDISFNAHVGEILGIAGAEGNGQRELMRALVGLERSMGQVVCEGVHVNTSSPRKALEGGVLYLSSDRKGEAIFPELSVRKNMVSSLLSSFARGGVLSKVAEEQCSSDMKRDFGVVAANLSVPVIGLSGGNQQKAVLARSFRSEAKAILIDEPTQGVDAGARFDIYKSIRANVELGGTCVVNSSDAQELAGICDRVLVVSRGRIVRELVGAELTEETIVSSFLTARDTRSAKKINESGAKVSPVLGVLRGGDVTWWAPLLFLVGLILAVSLYAAHTSPFFMSATNIRHMLWALAPAALVAMAQLNVLLVRGIDVSVGALMSLTVVVASFTIPPGATQSLIIIGSVICLGVGASVGVLNGVLVRFAGINAVITTIATLSIVQGFAFVGRPTPGGIIGSNFISFLKDRVGFLPYSTLFLVAIALLGDYWLHRTRSGLGLKATGFREEAAIRNGVGVNFVQLRAYFMSGVLAAIAGLFLGAQVAVGHPTVGQNFALSSIAATVIGGASLVGGRGSYTGAFLGALFFTLMLNVISLLGLSSAVGIIASGVMTLAAVLLYSSFGEIQIRIKKVIRSFSFRGSKQKERSSCL